MQERLPKVKPERVFADTNVFLRYLTNDLPAQADAVEDLLRRAAAGEVILVPNGLVVAEIVWTLESFYELPRNDIKDKVLAILNTPGLEVVQRDLVLQAISRYADKNVDFIDAYDAEWLTAEGPEKVFTFDRKHFSRIKEVALSVAGE